ncbi:MAG: cytochrome c oxidase subunit II [Alphaproteobacteria bacterium]
MTKSGTFLRSLLTWMPALLVFAFPLFAHAADGEALGLAKNWQLGFQEPASPVKEDMEWFHDMMLVPMTIIVSVFVMFLLLFVMVRYNAKANPVPTKTTHNAKLEFIWTIVPVLILIVISYPSMKLLYKADRTTEAEMTLNAIGNQWYWSYEYPDHGNITFNANLVKEKDLKEGQPRLLATDEPVVLPVDTNIRLLIKATDVLHAWAIPAFGVKLDAVPGQTNETWVRIEKTGTFYGQCSELCGEGHGFMPIEVHAVSKEDFAKWVASKGGKMPEAAPPAAGAAQAEETKEGAGKTEAPKKGE